MRRRHYHFREVAGAAVVAAIFIVDCLTPRGTTIGLLYVPAAWFFVRTPWRHALVAYAALASALIALGYLLSPPGMPLHATHWNRTLAVAAMWTVALLMTRIRDASSATMAANRELEARAAELKAAHAMLQESESELQETTERLLKAQRIAGVGFLDWDLQTGSIDWSEEVYRMYGVEPGPDAPTPEQTLSMAHPEDQDAVRERIELARQGLADYDIDHRMVRPDGGVVWVHAQAEFSRDAAGRPARLLGTVVDITERKALEEQFRQAQKMEAVGQLAGGIAHDFNNLLTVIMGNLHLLEELAKDRPDAAGPLQDLARAAARGAELTSRLLTISRRQALHPQAIHVNELIQGMDSLLRRTLGSNLSVALQLAADLPPVLVDCGQLEGAILNLALNSRDAMPRGGTLTLRTAAFTADADYASHHPDTVAGDYVLIEVSDSGTGMPPEVVARAFDPFFTTKQAGRGTGLGLSMVYGFLRQSGGHARIYSEPGAGTSVKLYLPARPALQAERSLPPADRQAPVQGGSERILVVEDDEAVRATATAILVSQGYEVLEADGAATALDALQREAGRIDLLLTDVMMPGGMDGHQLARRSRELFPDLGIILMSGFWRGHARDGAGATSGILYLEKPFSKDTLTRLVRQSLDSRRG